MTTTLQTKIEEVLADVGSTVESDKVERMVLPDGPWRRWWQGSGPERGDHVMLGRSHIAYFPAPDGTLGLHHEVGRIIYEHNCAVEKMADLLRECAEEIERLKAGMVGAYLAGNQRGHESTVEGYWSPDCDDCALEWIAENVQQKDQANERQD